MPHMVPQTSVDAPASDPVATLVHTLGAATMGVWGGALLVWPDRFCARLGSRAAPWYQREVALLDLGHVWAAVLCRSTVRGHLRALSITALLLAAGHTVEAVRHRPGRVFHGVSAALDAAWAVAGLLRARQRKAGR